MQADGAGWVPRTDDPDAVYDALTTWVERAGAEPVPAPGRGDHRAARRQQRRAGHADRVGEVAGGGGRARGGAGRRPGELLHGSDQGTGQREVLRATARSSVPANVGMLTGDASVNPEAPIICCTAEVLANIALREGPDADVGLVVMDEFHFYSEPDRGWAWQVPLLELTRAQFVLMSATLGDIGAMAADLTRRNGRATAVVDDAERPVPLIFSWAMTHLADTRRRARRGPAGSGRTSCTSPRRQRSSTPPRCSPPRPVSSSPGRPATRSTNDWSASASVRASARRCTSWSAAASASTTPGCCRATAASWSSWPSRGCWSSSAGPTPSGWASTCRSGRCCSPGSRSSTAPGNGSCARASSCRSPAAPAAPASTRSGYVVVQAPEHVIDNAIALEKIGDDPKKQRSVPPQEAARRRGRLVRGDLRQAGLGHRPSSSSRG